MNIPLARLATVVGSVLLAMVAFAPAALGQGMAESGSPLYTLAVRESIAALKRRGDADPAPSQEVCPHCGKIHPPAAPSLPATNTVAVAAAPVAAVAGQPCPVCGNIHPPAAPSAAQAQASPRAQQAAPVQGLGSGAYYYCSECKAYHRRQAAPPMMPAQGLMNPLVHRTNPLPTGAATGGPGGQSGPDAAKD